MVLVNNLVPGDWIVRVQGFANIGNPRQGYTLVVTADMPVWDNDYVSLKQFASDNGVSVGPDLLPALGISTTTNISLRRLMCTIN